MRTIPYQTKGIVFNFTSDLGVFSKDRIDFGSRNLIETILKEEKRTGLKILDVGCGYGFMGIVLSKLLKSHVDMVDVNKRAVHLCKKNIESRKVDATGFVSNIYESVEEKYDMIVTNPPIRAGKEVVLKILGDAKKHLRPDGILWFVIRKDQGAKSTIKYLEKEYVCEIVEKEKGFYMIRAKIH